MKTPDGRRGWASIYPNTAEIIHTSRSCRTILPPLRGYRIAAKLCVEHLFSVLYHSIEEIKNES